MITCDLHSGIEARLANVERNCVALSDAVVDIRNSLSQRLPPWGTLIISVLCGALGIVGGAVIEKLVLKD